MKKKTGILILGIILPILLLYILYYRDVKLYYNDENADGNASGNLYNSGLFCQLDNKIYFSNLADNGALYSMNTDMSTYKKISDDKVNYINASGHYIIYNRINNKKERSSGSALEFINVGVYRINLNGNNIKRLDKAPAGTVHQFGNDIYYVRYDKHDAYTLYSVGLDGSNQKQVLNEAVSPAMMTDEYIYYTGVKQDHNIYRLSRSSFQKELIKEGNYSQVILQGSSMYCINNSDNYSIVQMNTDGTLEKKIVNDRVATYNITPDGNYLFYQADGGDHNGVYLVNLSTGETDLIQAGNYQNLCLTDDYLFFNRFDSTAMFYVELSNPTKASEFRPNNK